MFFSVGKYYIQSDRENRAHGKKTKQSRRKWGKPKTICFWILWGLSASSNSLPSIWAPDLAYTITLVWLVSLSVFFFNWFNTMEIWNKARNIVILRPMRSINLGNMRFRLFGLKPNENSFENLIFCFLEIIGPAWMTFHPSIIIGSLAPSYILLKLIYAETIINLNMVPIL